ncbi:methyltransferase domain protein [Leptospira weilii str. 2006001853]|uniref:Methyltransferase domain protein n=3 Tax=Leptospira weilii TaxID=28184 RepID=A0A828Z667_9LEPT|nr:class I SAM-dependent methyltransferase [Leptospira weilii]EKR65004.1 methyltransferase domain protein [Leptospira weilii str. 2006001853]EMY16412.1 methyltransferase domain protein [Leptospira weilii str. Ecochallenge]MCL8268425.1 class I SAM-dependent methyltransferase [Leptospira weilii]UPY79230.1 class I SAM-dependent methyltransferase [Leptospira weilii]
MSEKRSEKFNSLNDFGSPMSMFRNRLSRMSKHWKKWARKRNIECFRIYDRDIPQVPVSVDLYGPYCQISAYKNSYEISDETRERENAEIGRIVAETLNLDAGSIFWKKREPKKGKKQYEKQSEQSKLLEVKESGLRFYINLSDYIDTGLFLDHRITRDLIRKESKGKKFLNLFSYTGSFTVYAASGGATQSLSVDLSNTYLAWAEENLKLNGLSLTKHRLLRADVMEWLYNERKKSDREKYDLIVLDPPTFSNSKKMTGIFDIQKDHVEILNILYQDFALPGAVLYFSTNFRKFELSPTSILWNNPKDITKTTLPDDFRNQKIHFCWKMEKPV